MKGRARCLPTVLSMNAGRGAEIRSQPNRGCAAWRVCKSYLGPSHDSSGRALTCTLVTVSTLQESLALLILASAARPQELHTSTAQNTRCYSPTGESWKSSCNASPSYYHSTRRIALAVRRGSTEDLLPRRNAREFFEAQVPRESNLYSA